jgi:hypothetical protein
MISTQDQASGRDGAAAESSPQSLSEETVREFFESFSFRKE